jgi:aminoglycoside 6'-N-acetyltransferase
VVLRPLTEADWPLVERINNDPRVAYYTEDGDWQPYTLERLQRIYRGISQQALLFVIEHAGRAVGECWLQRMNVPRILEEFPGRDVRRIDLAIGEPALWNRGLGSEAIRLLVGLAFGAEGADALVCFCGGHNPRSRRAFEKAGFRVLRTVPRPESAKTTFGYDLLLTREQYTQAEGALRDWIDARRRRWVAPSGPAAYSLSQMDGLQGVARRDPGGWRFVGHVDLEDFSFMDPRFPLAGYELGAEGVRGRKPIPASFYEGYRSRLPIDPSFAEARDVFKLYYLLSWLYIPYDARYHRSPAEQRRSIDHHESAILTLVRGERRPT